jgi:hypothetical protein
MFFPIGGHGPGLFEACIIIDLPFVNREVKFCIFYTDFIVFIEIRGINIFIYYVFTLVQTVIVIYFGFTLFKKRLGNRQVSLE